MGIEPTTYGLRNHRPENQENQKTANTPVITGDYCVLYGNKKCTFSPVSRRLLSESVGNVLAPRTAFLPDESSSIEPVLHLDESARYDPFVFHLLRCLQLLLSGIGGGIFWR